MFGHILRMNLEKDFGTIAAAGKLFYFRLDSAVGAIQVGAKVNFEVEDSAELFRQQLFDGLMKDVPGTGTHRKPHPPVERMARGKWPKLPRALNVIVEVEIHEQASCEGEDHETTI